MPRISRQSVDDVRQRADFVSLAGDYTTLKKVGSSWKGLSPFATEKTPSFYVHPDKGFFYCFSTSQGGDIFRFIALKEGLNFQESVERIAQRFGIPLKYEKGNLSHEDHSLRSQLLAIHEIATSFYFATFHEKNDLSASIRQYWINDRHFTLKIAEEFKIGFAPVNGGNLTQTLLKKGFSKEALAKSGLFTGIDYSPNDPRRWLPRFHGRLIIPIRDTQSRVVAFSARILPFSPQNDPTREAKYLNSPETEIFHKSQILFNLDKARDAVRSSTAPIVLVEGQLDAIRAYSCGITTAVASQGTAISTEHIALLRRYTRRIDALLDADRAGQNAALKLIPLALRANIELRFLSIPNGKDPDEYLALAGTTGWHAIESTATTAIAYATRTFLPPNTPRSQAQKHDALQSLFEIIAQAESSTTRKDALNEICRIAGLDILSTDKDFHLFEKTLRRRRNNNDTDNNTTSPPPESPSSLNSATETLLYLALTYKTLITPLATITNPEWIDASTLAGQLLNRLLAAVTEGIWQHDQASHLLSETDSERDFLARTLITYNTIRPISSPLKKTQTHTHATLTEEEITAIANESLHKLFNLFARKRRDEINAIITSLPPDDTSTLPRLQKEENFLRQKLKSPPRLPDPQVNPKSD
ncbi:MAG: DNA primase [Puniceicoccales bacterium]|nr:DNA primase [Puniceicoccales bacterium]